MSDLQITPTSEQIDQSKKAIESYYLEWYSHPNKRADCFPYYRFHEPGEAIRGTIMIFHGFGAKPKQMEVLSEYLFANNFNIYQIPIAGHAYLPADEYWPEIDLKPEFLKPLQDQLLKDPVIDNFFNNPISFGRTPLPQKLAIVARLVKIAPKLLDMALAIERQNDPDFQRYYDSTHLNFLNDAQARLQELEAMPGPIYTIGLSVGGAVALGLAELQPDRIKKVVAYAPLLEVNSEINERFINLTGPLDLGRNRLGELSWDQQLWFPVGCLTAANRFGAFVRSSKNIQALKNTPVCLFLTDNEDATDNEVINKFYDSIGGKARGHRIYTYPKEDAVPHPMVDPREVSRGMRNLFWKSLYQETYRFLTEGQIKPENLSRVEEADDVPKMPNF